MPYTLGLQIVQSRSYLYTLGPKVGIIYILGALGICFEEHRFTRPSGHGLPTTGAMAETWAQRAHGFWAQHKGPIMV